jgi:hypothetical protein
MLEDRESTQIQVLWDMMLNKNHTQSTFLPKISNPALSEKCQNPNTKSTFFFFFFFFFFFAVSPFSSLAGSPHPCEASYQIALPVTMQIANHAEVFTKYNI